ncbi:MAG TPA: phospholipase D-like domain-containing protein [Candidatus Saccharimonadales bacterium]|nr:phospholipase D-like domain-containing protein [Candidatus Saccharimonadales bacterium]
MFSLRSLREDNNLLGSKLLNQDNFYSALTGDLMRAQREVIIESPFISAKRLNYLLPIFQKLTWRKVSVVVNTKPPEEQLDYGLHAAECIEALQEIGVDVLITGGHHRKLAIIDRQVLYEGSLNILSQNDSCEVMRRIYSEQLVAQMVNFIGISKFIG